MEPEKTNIEEVLSKVGFEIIPDKYQSRTITLRDGREAVLWVDKINGHGILDPLYWIDAEEYEEEYRNTASANINSKTSPAEHSIIYKDLNKQQYDQFGELITPTSDVLEIGSSFGGVLRFIVSESDANSITSIEPNKEDSEYIRELYGNKVEVKNDFFTEDTDLGSKFDLIVSFEVLEHIETPNDFIKGMYNNLKVGGKVNIEVPNHNELLVHVLNNKAYTDFYYHKAHIHYFTPTSLKEMFENNGISGEVSGFQMYPATNQLSWIYTNKPQANATIAFGYPDAMENNQELIAVIDRFNSDYKLTIERLLLSDCLVFTGTKV